tara:strand:+ start:205 stop:360 length:156 start_codon:yes stop_codon:yes gene_type:complete
MINDEDMTKSLWNIHSEIVQLLRDEVRTLQIKLAIAEEENKQLKIRLGDPA